MIKGLSVSNFTCFSRAELEYSSEISIIMGANGTGKSNILKWNHLATASPLAGELDGHNSPKFVFESKAFKENFKSAFHFSVEEKQKIVHVWPGLIHVCIIRHCEFNRCVETKSVVVGSDLRAGTRLQKSDECIHFSEPFKNGITTIVSKELLFLGAAHAVFGYKLLENLDYLSANLLALLSKERKPNLRDSFSEIRKKIQDLLGGKVQLYDGQMVVDTEVSILPVAMVAEGKRKFAALWQLLSNGSINPGDTLQIDEPEANLNPKLIHEMAEIIVMLSKAGVQVILATHSMYLVREIRLAAAKHEAETQYILLEFEGGDPTAPVKATQSDDFRALKGIPSLRAELDQIERYEEMGW